MGGSRVTQAVYEDWKKRQNEGEPATQIGKDTGFHADTVRDYLSGRKTVTSSASSDDDDDDDPSGGGILTPDPPTGSSNSAPAPPPASAPDQPSVGSPDASVPGEGLLGPTEGDDLSTIVKRNMEMLGLDKKKISVVLNAIDTGFGQHEYNGLFNFLTGLKIKGEYAKMVCDLTFDNLNRSQWESQNQWGHSPPGMGPGRPGTGYGPPGRGPGPMRGSPQGYGAPPQGYGAPPGYGPPPPPPQQGYYDQQGYWIPPPASQQPQLSAAEIEAKIQTGVDNRLTAQKEVSAQEKRFNTLEEAMTTVLKHIGDGGGSAGQTVTRPFRDPATGDFVINPQTGDVLMETVPISLIENNQGQSGETAVVGMLKDMVLNLMPKAGESGGSSKEELLALMDAKVAAATSEQAATFNRELDVVARDRDKLEGQLTAERTRTGGQLSENATVAVKALDSKKDVTVAAVDGLKDTVKEGFALVRDLVKPETPQAYSKAKQWGNADLDDAQNWLDS